MEIQQFMAIFEGYWPSARNVKAPKQQELWADTIDGIPDPLLAYATKRYARGAKYPPTVMEFEKYLWPLMDEWAARNPSDSLALDWNRRMKALREADMPRPEPERRPCAGCEADIRFDPGPPLKRFDGDGGLVFKFGAGERWYACRCPECGGPGAHRPLARYNESLPYSRYCSPNSLPVPPAQEWEDGLWVPISQTPAGPHWDTVLRERIIRPTDPRYALYWSWVRQAVRNSRERIGEVIAADEQRLREEERVAREAAWEKLVAEREAAGQPVPEQAALALAEPESEPEPGPEPEPAPDAADDPNFGNVGLDPDDFVPF